MPDFANSVTRRKLLHFAALGASSCMILPNNSRADDPPLSPSSGGRSILSTAMQKGDIILSTTSAATVNWLSAAVSQAIRAATGNGPVSHSALYVGGDQVIDARPASGVALSSLTDSLSSASIAVAFRFPNIRTDQQDAIANFGYPLLGRAYDFAGAVANAHYFFGAAAHVLVDLGISDNKFYCSKLVLDAYSGSGADLVTVNPSWRSPNDLVALSWFGELEYVGHLKS